MEKIRADVEALQRILQNIQSGLTTAADCTGSIKEVVSRASQSLKEVEQIQDTHQALNGDDIEALHNTWLMITECKITFGNGSRTKPQKQLNQLRVLEDLCRNVIFRIGTLTIPARLNLWLDQQRPGYYIAFHQIFQDELPIFEDRVKVLSAIATAPNFLANGYVDVVNGLIYRYSRSIVGQIRSLGLFLICFLLCGALVWISSSLPSDMLPVHIPAHPVILWGSVVVGVIAHAAVAMAKRFQTNRSLPPIIALSDITRIIDAKIGPLLLKLFLTLFGLFGLIFSGQSVTTLTAFLVGYSLDSVVELFAAGVEQRAGAQAATLQQQLGVRK